MKWELCIRFNSFSRRPCAGIEQQCAIWYTGDMTTALKNEIRKLARESVREVIDTEMMRLRASLLLSVSQKEQKNIEKLYKKPSRQAVRTVRVRV